MITLITNNPDLKYYLWTLVVFSILTFITGRIVGYPWKEAFYYAAMLLIGFPTIYFVLVVFLSLAPKY